MENPLKIDKKEFELPETLYARDIETRVIQVIILHCLGKIEGIALSGGTLMDALFGRDNERVKGIFVEQDAKNHQVKVKVEILVDYGVIIPKKSEEVQKKIVEEITQLTGLHVAVVHVVVKGLNSPKPKENNNDNISLLLKENLMDEDEFSDKPL